MHVQRGVAVKRLATVLTLVAGLTACSDTWLGESEEDPPLPGERIAVLSRAGGISAAPDLAGQAPRLPQPFGNDNWPQAAAGPTHAPGHLALGGELTRAWQTSVGRGSDERGRLVSAPVVADGKVFAMDAGAGLTAVDAATGRRVWQVDLVPEGEDEGGAGGGVAYADGVLVAATGYAEVLALDPKDGAIKWRQRVSAPVRSAPTIADGRVFAISIDNRAHALSLADGDVLWSHAGLNEVAGLLGSASPAVSDGVVVVPYSSGEVYALRADNGSVLWIDSMAALARTDAVARLTDIRALPVMRDGRVYVVGNSNMSAAIDVRSGRRAWDVGTGGLQTPWLAGDVLFVLAHGPRLVALQAQTGKAYWVTDLPRWNDPEDEEGRILWHGPVLAGGNLVLANSEGELVLVSPADGSILARRDLPGQPAAAPVVAGGTLYIMTESGDLVAYR